MDVLFYLKELLKSHTTISIAGLGTLYKKKFAGKYDDQKHSFVPPSYALNFTSEVNEHEELVNFIAVEENIDIDFAKLQIKEFTEKIFVQLNENQEVILNGLGKFILVGNEITFLADENNDFENEFYGLPNLNEITEPNQKTVYIAEVENNSIDQKEPETINSKNELENLTLDSQLKFTGKPFTPNFDYDDNESYTEISNPVKILLKILLLIAIIAGIIILAYFFNPGFFDNKIKGNKSEISNAEPVVTNDSLNKEDIQLNIDSNNKNLDSSVIVKEQPKTIVTQVVQTIDNSSITYEVIGSAEKSKKRIDLVMNTMKKRGIEAKALENVPGKLVKISLGSFTNLALAKKYKDSLRKKLNNPEIYIQTIKPKK